jgi:restriction system protein
VNSLEAIYRVLEEAGKPLSVMEITKLILEKGYWSTQGKTPAATISATLSSDVKEKGAMSRFIHTGPAQYGLNPKYTPPAEKAVTGKTLEINVGETISVKDSVTYSFTDAAEHILRTFASQQPMHYQEITQKALDMKLLSTKGLTPEATMYAQIITEIQRRKRRGEQPRFVMHGKGMVGLAVWEPEGLAGMIEGHNRTVRKQLLTKIREMQADEFEELIARLLTALGFEDVTVTTFTGDKGIDVRGTLVVGDSIRTRMAVQVKKWKNNVQAPTVQQVRGSLSTHEQGLIITTSDFSRGAVAEANQADKIPVALMNGERLVDLLIENDIGITRTSYDLIEMGEDENET